MLKQGIIGIVISFLSTTAIGSDWSINTHGVGFGIQKEQVSDDKVNVMVITRNYMAYVIMGFDESYCYDRAMLVNGKGVSFEASFEKSDNKYIKPHACYYMPKTEKGADYLFNTFIESTEVVVNGNRFSAIGFISVVEQLASLDEAM
ncbi:hypothetical protein V9657_004665 [Vibrio vulnificus]|uniref:hypothetical protein n=1 Tax=Vibrio vulnificus TaxID=672 RepID=UPI001A32B063|nr:hypothetical protein [Vibrio vulnificus]EHZ2848603.1 hypothetical protein [Vibrio vulnificus]EJL7832746.1 hypothetical protein [Vibrio vulnificus]